MTVMAHTGVRYLELDVLEADDVRRARADNRLDAAQRPLVRGDDQQPTQERRKGHEGTNRAASPIPLGIPSPKTQTLNPQPYP